MSSDPPLHPSSRNPHRALMLIMIVITGLVLFGLVIGWQSYFDRTSRREAIMQFAAKKEAELKLRNEAATAAELSAAVPAPTPTDGLPRVSLADMAKESRADEDNTAVPAETVTITLPIDPGSPDVQQADDLLTNYAKAKKWQDKIPFVYQPDRTRVLMEQFYEVQKASDPVSGALLNRGHYRLDGTEILHYTYSCNRPGDVLELALRRGPDGRFLLDWTSFVGFSQMSWEQFKKERTTEATLFRAFATASDYFNYEFSDQKSYLSINLVSPDGLVSLHGFCQRNTPMATALSQTLSRSNSMSGIVVRLAFPERSESDHCVWIRQFVSDRWLVLP